MQAKRFYTTPTRLLLAAFMLLLFLFLASACAPRSEAPPPEVVGDPGVASCFMISGEEAAAILGEPVDPRGMGIPPNEFSDEVCIYFLLDTDAEPMLSVQAELARGKTVAAALARIADVLEEATTTNNEAARHLFDAAIESGDMRQALQRLRELVAGESIAEVETLSEVSDATMLLWRPFTPNGDTPDRDLVVLLTLNPAGELMSVEAIVLKARSRSAIRAAMVTLAQRLVQSTQ